MTPRNSHFPRPPFDPHAEIDDGYSRLDRLDGLGTRTAPVPAYRAVVSVTPDDPYHARKSRSIAAWIAGVLFVACLVLLVIAVKVVS